MLKSRILAILLIIATNCFPQEQKSHSLQMKASLYSYLSSGNDLPFWITSNQNGIFSDANSSFQIAQLKVENSLQNDSLKKLQFFYGANLVYFYSSKSEFQFNQYWIGSRYKRLMMKVGAQAEPVQYNGLSSTNGNMDWSDNSRPLPGISVFTDDFVPLFFGKQWLSLKALYSENFLLDNRYVENVHLHHKYLIGRASIKQVKFSLGLDHWVYWGGNSPVFGKLAGFDNYINYIIGLKGTSNSPTTERNNVAGNSLGLYLMTIEKEFKTFDLSFYYNHPFEDRSGLELDNMPDGLWGLYYHLKSRKGIFSDLLYEFQNTTNQSGTYNMVQVGNRLTGRGNDNYFNNFIYKSGHVHYNRMMGSPFFVPVLDADGISKGFDNTRIILHHIGLGGWFSERLNWKSLLSWSRGFGTYDEGGIFPEPLNQFSFLMEGGYLFKKTPLRLNLGIAGDQGQRFQKRIGGFAGLSWFLR